MPTPIQFQLVLSLCAVLLAFTGCARTRPTDRRADVIWNDDPTLRIDLPAAESRLRQGLQSGKVVRLIVLQMDRRFTYRVNVSSMSLERNYHYRLDNRSDKISPVGSDFLDALTRARPLPSDRPADLRWGFIFYGEDDERVFSAYCDATGKHGVIDGACYTFEVGSLAELADSLFPKWMK